MLPAGLKIGGYTLKLTKQQSPPVACGVDERAVKYSIQFPDRGFLPDTIAEVRGVQALSRRLATTGDPHRTVLETSSRVGITGPVWLEDLGANKLILNDLNEELAAQLRRNYPSAEVHQQDVRQWAWPPADVVYADMNTFTLRKIDMWGHIFSRAAATKGWFIFVDSCCFGFGFGRRASYLPYGPTPEHYWRALSQALWDRYGLGVAYGSLARRAAFLAADHTAHDIIDWLPPGDKAVSYFYNNQLF